MTINNDNKKTILVVDDDQGNIEILENILNDYYKVLAAKSGEEALDTVQKNPDISVILLDIIIPGMDGYEVIKRLKRSNATKHIPVIFVTAKERINDQIFGFSLGAADYISKPISPAITLARVKTHLTLYEQQKQLEQQNIHLKSVNSNLKKITEQLSKDSLTGLEREQAFHSEIKQMFTQRKDGYILSIEIDNFTNFVNKHNNSIVEGFIRDFAEVLNNTDESVAYRFYGSIFAIISTQTDYAEIEFIIKHMIDDFELLGDKYGLSSIAHIGATPFNPIGTTNSILEHAHDAREKARSIGSNAYFIRDRNDLAKDMEVWKDVVSDIIDNKTFNLGFINQTTSMDKQRELLHKETFIYAADKDNIAIPTGTLISVAERYNKIISFDKAVILQIIEQIKTEKMSYKIIINLTFDSLVDIDFKRWLTAILSNNKDLSNQLVFSVTAYTCVRDLDVIKTFIALIHENNAKFIIKRYDPKFIPVDNLKELKLDYIRFAKDFTLGVYSDSNKQNLIRSICETTYSNNIEVFAGNVDNEDDFSKLSELGVYGANIKTILQYEGKLSQSFISHSMNAIEENVLNKGIVSKLTTVTLEILQNMMSYSKSKDPMSTEFMPRGYIKVTKNKNHVYHIKSQNIISSEDKIKIEPILIEIQSLDASDIKKRYREMRKNGINAHGKGNAGIGFYEIAKQVVDVGYRFTEINEQKYYFEFMTNVKSRKNKSK